MKKKYIIIALLLLIPEFYFGYYVYEEYFEEKEIQTIKADLKPHRVRPEKSDDFRENGYNPIYDNIKSNKHNVKSSKLAKLPEKPIKIASKPDKNDPISNIISDKREPQRSNKKNLKIISETNNVLAKNKKDVYHEKRYFIQVATTRSVSDAKKEFYRISKKHSSILKSNGYKIIRYKVKNKGVFFKLLIGPLKGPEQGRLMCKKLIQSKQSCIVKRI